MLRNRHSEKEGFEGFLRLHLGQVYREGMLGRCMSEKVKNEKRKVKGGRWKDCLKGFAVCGFAGRWGLG